MSGIDTYPVGDMALVRAPRSGAVALVDGAARAILEGLAAGGRAQALARAHAARLGGDVRAAAAHVAGLRQAWRELDALAFEPVPARPEPPASLPALDVRCRIGTAVIRLRVWPPVLARLVSAVTAPARVAAGDGATAAVLEARRANGRYHLSLDGTPLFATDDLMTARSETLRRLILASHPGRDWLAVLHAAVVAGPEGGVLLCGCSGAGKSTLTGLLVASGLDLVTDDYAPVETGTRLLWPVPFGLSVKEGSWPVLGPHFPGLARAPVVRTRRRRMRYVAAPAMAPAPVPARCLVFPLYQPGAPVELTPLEPGESLQLLVRSGGWYESSRERLAALVDWIAATPAYALAYGDGAAAVAEVRGLLAAP